MVSLWLDRTEHPTTDAWRPGARVDTLVVGAGLTGLTTGLLFRRAGESVTVLEARHVGAATTGNTTAKVSLLHGTKLSRIRGKHSAGLARAYVEANREGQQWLLRYCADRGVPVQRETAYSYALSGSGMDTLRREFDAGTAAGLDLEWSDGSELPYRVAGAVALEDQAQVDPLDLLVALVFDLRERGGTVVEGVRVRSVHSSGETLRVDTDHGPLEARRVVLATGVPILDRGGFFARLHPMRSYSAAFDNLDNVPRGMYLSVESPTRSLRSVPTVDGTRLLVGGNGHVVGRGGSTRLRVDDLVAWTSRHFPGAHLTHSWSAQDYHPVDELPYVGPLLPREHRVLVATGYDKWGMTNAVAAALSLAGGALGGHMEWAGAYDAWNPRLLAGAVNAAKLNGEVAVELAAGWIRPLLQPWHGTPGNGDGHVRPCLGAPEAVSTVDGHQRRVSAVCTHLGGVVRWNDAEQSWDCPLHGSRFAADGRVLEGPATRDLAPRER
ncbi:FAD-dependent oxidoreductase [Rhodococcus sp. NPDC003318]|uniref:FAD-dependent oxidoreductase n=1 Tax=Rhodococcus sp. NPDC003318 TaxID=3364503 RepID=UPI003687EB28